MSSLLVRRLAVAAGCGAALLAGPALAQQPAASPTLLGRWQARQISFNVPEAVPDSVLAQLDNPEIASLNEAVFLGTARLEVEFRADSTYQFTIVRDEHLLRTETGTYSLAHGYLRASSPTSPDGSSFDEQQVRRLTRRQLVLLLPAGPELPGVEEEIEYRRVGKYPASAGAGPSEGQ